MMEEYKKYLETNWTLQSTEANWFHAYAVWVGGVDKLNERYGDGFKCLIMMMDEHFGYGFYSTADIARLASKVVEDEKRHRGSLDAVIAESRKDMRLLSEAFKAVDELDLAELTDGELAAEQNKFYAVYLNFWGLSSLADAFSMHSEVLLSERLAPCLQRCGEGRNLNRCLSVLSAPVKNSFLQEETESLYRLAKAASESKALREALLLPADKRMHALRTFSSFFHGLTKHSKKFFWVQNSYLRARYLDESYFADRIADLLKERIDFERKLESIGRSAQDARIAKAEVLERIGGGEDLLQMVKIIEKFAVWHDERKKHNLIGDYYLAIFLEELCRRKGYEKEAWLGLTPPEYADALKGRVDAKAMAVRSKTSMVIFEPGYAVALLAGNEAKALFKRLEQSGEAEITDVRGTCASPGRTQGTVRIIIGTKDLPKMKPGDVLVAPSTRPELVLAMKKAAAIVTDEGGLTSHAAIVSRELGIPCVVGTKLATKAFKDGDFVEVNANHGVVRKVR